MYVSRESPEETDRRLRRVAAATDIEVLEGEWWFEEFPLERLADHVRPDAIALVRDSDGWSQLVPARTDDHPTERFRLWCCHFPTDLDNSGFIGWLATRIKRKTGSGILVVCGQNNARGGIYDYAGCPAGVADIVLGEIRALIADSQSVTPQQSRVESIADSQSVMPQQSRVESLDGRQMRAVATADGGEVSVDTLFTFVQVGNTVSAQYAGGTVRLGHLVGTLAGRELSFRYAQVDHAGRVDGGRSVCDVSLLTDGRVQLREHFHWESRDGSGTNILEEIKG
jgi:hypothetical protein